MTTEADNPEDRLRRACRRASQIVGLVSSDVVLDEDFDGDKIIRVIAHFDRAAEDVAEVLVRRRAMRSARV